MLFSIKSSKLCRNMRKLRMKLHNATIYPPWGPIFPPSFEMLDLLWRLHLKDIDEKNYGLFNQVRYKSQFSVKCIGVCFFKKMAWQSLLHGKINLNISTYKISETFQRYGQDMTKICLIYAKDRPKTWPRYAKYIPKIHLRYALNRFKLCWR